MCKVREAARPNTKKEVRSLTGLTEFSGDYVLKYAAVAAPLKKIAKKLQSNRLEWKNAQENALSVLKVAITSRLLLRLPDHSKMSVLRADASDVEIGNFLCRNMTIYISQ